MGKLVGLPMKTRARPNLPKRPSARERRSTEQVTEAEMAQSSVIGAKAKNGNGHANTKGKRAQKTQTGGIRVTRHFTQPGVDPLEAGAPGENGQPLVYERRSSVITNPDGSIVFKMEGAEIPAGWSQLATDIV